MMIRSAKSDDAIFVAWVCLTALGFERISDEQLADVGEICRREDVIYSWKNALIAEINGQYAGALICYDGTCYEQMRSITFPLIAKQSGNDFSDMEMETGPGEFYLDSMAVKPEYRQQGVATALLTAGIVRACKLNIPRTAMVVSPHNPDAQRLYESLGFRFERNMLLFGEEYRKMILKTEHFR